MMTRKRERCDMSVCQKEKECTLVYTGEGERERLMRDQEMFVC